jgi:hypothetical protein
MSDTSLPLKQLANQGLREVLKQYSSGCGGCVHAHWVGYPQLPSKGNTPDRVEFCVGVCQAGIALGREKYGLTPTLFCTARATVKTGTPVAPPQRSEVRESSRTSLGP